MMRRTPLRRRTPLGAGTPLGTKTGSEGKHRAAPKDTGPSRKTRALVLARDGHACVCCGRSVIGQVASLQHRKRRSQGGGNSPANLITVLGDGTTGCHARIDSRRDPEDAAKGYTCQSWEDPASVPVMYFDESGCGVTLYLEADGGLTQDAPARVSV